jgi:CubicO group peptidase (beta-lactamase class C family)
MASDTTRSDNALADSIADLRFQCLCEQATTAMQRLAVPGVAMGVSHQGQEAIAGLGVTSVEHPLPVNPDTLFQIGSITKTFTATAIFRLVERGSLTLDAPLRTYLPDLRLADEDVAARVALRHILSHTGGWQGDHYYRECGRGDDALERLVASMADLPQITPLGAIWFYSNSGYYLAGRVIEVVTGKSYEAALQELVLDPLGLKTAFFYASDVMTRRFAVGHEVVDGQSRVARPWEMPRAVAPVGGLTCTTGDLLRYARFHMGDGHAADGAPLLSPASLAQMQTPQRQASGRESIGLNWFISRVDGVTIIRHGGGTNGQIAELCMAPSRQFAIAILANSDTARALCDEVSHAALQHYLNLPVGPIHELALRRPAADELAPYVGRYDAAAIACQVSPGPEGLLLHVTYKAMAAPPDQPPPPAMPLMRIAFYAPDRFAVLDDPLRGQYGEFLRDDQGKIVWLRFRMRLLARQPAP